MLRQLFQCGEICQTDGKNIGTLDYIASNRAYSVVEFSIDASWTLNIITSSIEILGALDVLTYYGRKANHIYAMTACWGSLLSLSLSSGGGKEDMKNFIPLIMDGNPLEPHGLPRVDAEEATAEAKVGGCLSFQ